MKIIALLNIAYNFDILHSHEHHSMDKSTHLLDTGRHFSGNSYFLNQDNNSADVATSSIVSIKRPLILHEASHLLVNKTK